MRYLAILLTLFFVGCTLGPKYKLPKVCMPTGWKNKTPICKRVPKVEYWWQIFHDPILDCLEKQAITHNKTVYVALQRVLEARALAGVQKASLYPNVQLNPLYSNTGELLFFPISGQADVLRVHELQYILPINVNYELDLWGAVRGQYKSAALTADAQQKALCTALLTLTSDLASSYYQARSLDGQLQILQETLALYQKELNLTEERHKKGLVSYLDVANASLQLSNTQASYFDLKAKRKIYENKIATLLGKPASCFCLEAMPLQEQPPCVPPNLPSDVIKRRPDVAEAERKMASQHAMIGVAYANFFPSLNLTGTLGYSAPRFTYFLTWLSRLWSYGASMSQVIFDAGQNCENLEATFARFRQASGSYQQTILVAFQEVEDALNNLEMQSHQGQSLRAANQAANQAAALTRNRYTNGLGNYLDVIQTEQLALDARLNVETLLGVQYLSTIQLVKALGGSFPCEPSIAGGCGREE